MNNLSPLGAGWYVVVMIHVNPYGQLSQRYKIKLVITCIQQLLDLLNDIVEAWTIGVISVEFMLQDGEAEDANGNQPNNLGPDLPS